MIYFSFDVKKRLKMQLLLIKENMEIEIEESEAAELLPLL